MYINALATHFHSVAMKNLLLFVSLLYLIGSCRPKDQEPVPSVYPELQIKAIHFPGIPDENITIDPLKWTIHVKMPAAVTATHLTPMVVLSEKAQLDHPSELTNLSRVYGWKSPNEEEINVRISSRTDPDKKINYTIKSTPSAPLKITQSKPPVDFVIGDSSFINVDVDNPYGNVLPKKVIFKNKQTGDEHSATYIIPSLNKFRIHVYTLPFELAEYDISFQMVDGTELKVPYAVAIKQGKLQFGGTMRIVPGKDLTLNGLNMFAANVAFRLLYPNGQTLPLKATYTLNGRESALAIPSSVLPGYYGIEAIRDNRPVGISYRLSIVKSEDQLSIVGLNKLPSNNYPIDDPMVLPRNQPIPVNISAKGLYGISDNSDRFMMTCVDESNPSLSFRLPITIRLEFTPFFSIPSAIPAGRYKVFAQEINPITKEVLQQSEPFERIVVLQ